MPDDRHGARSGSCHGATPAQQQVLFENTARSIGGAPQSIQLRHIGNCMKADPAYGKGVADALGIDIAAETG